MKNNYIYIKLNSNGNIYPGNLKIELVNRCNKNIFNGKTDYFGKIKIPINNNEVYRLVIYSNLLIMKIPLIAIKDEVYYINIGNNGVSNRKHLVTFTLMDKYNPNIKIKGGNLIIWRDIQSQ